MKERPIPFSAESVRAILDGRKTQTRRVFKFRCAPYRQHQEHFEWRQVVQIPDTFEWIFWDHIVPENEILTRKAYKAGDGIKCPYGVPGERLWVKETWRYADKLIDGYDRDCPYYLQYEADGTIYEINGYEGQESIKLWEKGGDWSTSNKFGKWRSSRFMPRWASRITLEITDVRPERLQEISEEDVIAEGYRRTAFGLEEWFSGLWDTLNAKRGFGWGVNPWVFVIEFKMLPTMATNGNERGELTWTQKS